MPLIFHITAAAEVPPAAAISFYVPKRYAADGFIHCSYAHQVTAVANRIFRGQAGLVILEIDTSKVATKIIDENLEGGTELFPHIYGPLPMTAVLRVLDFACSTDGSFRVFEEYVR